MIRIAENSGDYINPLDISLAYGSDDPETKSSPVPAKVSFIQSLVRMMASSVNDAQANVLDAAAAYAYNRYLDDPRPENLPTLQDIYDFLMSEQGSDMRDARDLAKLIRRYVTGTLSLFNHPTNVDLQSNLVCFDLHELSSELKPLALLIILDHIWVRVSANRRAEGEPGSLSTSSSSCSTAPMRAARSTASSPVAENGTSTSTPSRRTSRVSSTARRRATCSRTRPS